MSNSKKIILIGKRYEIIIHIVLWIYVLFSPIIFNPEDRPFDIIREAHLLLLPICWCIIFYLNYFWTVPHFYQNHKYTKYFLSAAIIFCVMLTVRPLIEIAFPKFFPMPPSEDKAAWQARSVADIFELRRILHEGLTFIFITIIALLARTVRKWQDMKAELQVARLQKTEAEIQNLKYQINPHFLLNALNNIYALTAIDTDKAQTAITELSKMMRYLLSNFDTPTVQLRQEIDFIETYVNLMRLRMTDKVDLKFNVEVPESNNMEVAPMIFISLVENAFKHGISTDEKSFIHIDFKAQNNVIHFECVNSNFPKNYEDKTPSGVGLKLVRQRLELAYPNNYNYISQLSDDGKTFTTIIDIDL